MRISDWSSDVCSSDLMELGYSFSMAIPRPPRLMHYKLDGRRSVPCDSLVEWSMWMAEGDRRVAGTWIDDVRISTVFLGLDHNHALGGDPLLFEPMVFVDGVTNERRRYLNWEEAAAGHARENPLTRAAKRGAP